MLHLESEQRADVWKQVLSIPYGGISESPDTVGLSAGGDQGGVVWYGPESATPAARDRWWIVDSANSRVALFDGGQLQIAVEVEQRSGLQRGDVTAEGHFLAHTKPTAILIDGETGELIDPQGAEGLLRRMNGSLSEQGEFRTRSKCGAIQGGLALVADRTVVPAGSTLQSVVEGFCSPDGVVHLLWYGYWADGAGGTTAVASYIRVSDGGGHSDIEVDPIGVLSSEHDPGALARLSIVPGTNEAAIAIIGSEGVEGWVRIAPGD